MSVPADPRRRIVWVLPPLAVGIALLLLVVSGKQPPVRTELGERAHAVRVVPARSVDLVPVAEGYGVVKPARVWAAVAQVAGRVIEMHPRLRDGEILPRDTALFRIDPVDYELSLAQARAELAELEASEDNTRASLAIDRQDLELARREMQRIARLKERGTASGSDVDSAQRAVLKARAAVQNGENTLALVPARRRLLEAKVTQAERDLANTRVRAPFDMRVAELTVEQDQYVGVGQVLFSGDSVDRVEVVAQLALSSLRNLFLGRGDSIPAVADMESSLRDFTGFRPVIRMDTGNSEAEWQAEFVRFSDQVDPQTRTIGVVVAVADPLGKAIPGRRPPLSKGMFVRVIIRGHTQPARVVAPRHAIRDGRVYLVDAEQRLVLRPVQVLFSQGPASVLGSGLEAGERVVVTDLVPAVPGMLLAPELDEALLREMMAAAAPGQ